MCAAFKVIKVLNDDCWKMIKEMANACDLLTWLDGLRSDALENVINGADDQSDEHLIQEDTVSALMEVRQFVTPLKPPERLKIDEFFNKLRGLTDSNKKLVERISRCSANYSALRNI